MIRFLWGIIFGKCEIRCSSAHAKKLFEIIRSFGHTMGTVSYSDNEYTAIVSEMMLGNFIKAADEAEIEYTVRRLPGLPALFHRYKYRPGIFIGIVLFFFIISFSGRIIWDYEITGNEYTSDAEIIEALESVGCGSGALISHIHFAKIQNKCLIDADTLAWISVNMDGNLARVEVREKRSVPIEYTPVKGRFANIIAAEDGVVELCRVKNGKAVVEPGTVVKKGELLISGVIDVGETDVRYEYADGEVLATVYREIESFVPFDRTIQVPTGEKKSEIQLKIFGKMTNLSPKGRIDYELYGKIIESEKLSLPYDITLPIWITKTVYSEMQQETVNVSEEEARAIAEQEVTAKLSAMAETLQVLTVSRKCETEETGVRVTLGVYGVTDISANYGFSVSGEDTEEDEEDQKNEENHNS